MKPTFQVLVLLAGHNMAASPGQQFSPMRNWSTSAAATVVVTPCLVLYAIEKK